MRGEYVKTYAVIGGNKFVKDLFLFKKGKDYWVYNSDCDGGILEFDSKNGNLKGWGISIGNADVEEMASINIKKVPIRGEKVSCPETKDKYVCIIYNHLDKYYSCWAFPEECTKYNKYFKNFKKTSGSKKELSKAYEECSEFTNFRRKALGFLKESAKAQEP